MTDDLTVKHEFVEFIPDMLEDRTLYISREHGTAVHKCFCGCQKEVVTPLSEVGWQLECVGATVSLYPSIGNWNSPCKSHYWIVRSRVEWASQWSDEEIQEGRAMEARRREEYYTSIRKSGESHQVKREVPNGRKLPLFIRLIQRLLGLINRR